MDKNKFSCSLTLIFMLISLVFSLSYVSRVVFWQRKTRYKKGNPQTIENYLLENKPITYHSRNGTLIMELILLILTTMCIVLIGYGKTVLHKRIPLLLAGVYMLCLVLLVLFAGLSFTGSKGEYFWIQQAINFKYLSPILTGDTL